MTPPVWWVWYKVICFIIAFNVNKLRSCDVLCAYAHLVRWAAISRIAWTYIWWIVIILFDYKFLRDCAPYAVNYVCTSQLSLIIDIVGLSIQSNLYYTHFKKSVVTALPKLAIPQFYIISYFRIITLHLTLLVNIGRADNVCLVRWTAISRVAWTYLEQFVIIRFI